MDYHGRQRRAQQAMEEQRLDAFLVTHLPNIRYLCGFTGSAGALGLGGGRCVLFTDGRYREQARAEARGARVMIARGAALAAAAGWLKGLRARALGVEAEHLSLAARSALRALLPGGMRLRETAGLVERLRMVKEPEELALIRQAVRLGSRLFQGVVASLRPGVAENEVAARLEYRARRAGAEGMSFGTIVASGRRSALPHGVASAQPLPARGFVLLDYGVILTGYCSDMSRTVHLGRPSDAARRMYAAVLEAQLAAVSRVAPGVAAGEVDEAARRSLRRNGLGRYFTHSTGHGVGLEIHEPPRLGRGQDEELQPGMVITIEPGVYLAGRGGVRIEDMVAVTESGREVLTPTTKELIAVPGARLPRRSQAES
jgi:Xaa-Pro aminopeptidase